MFDIPFHINLFISLTEVEHPLKTTKKKKKKNTCKFKIDKTPYSKRGLEQHMTLAKISLYCILKQNIFTYD